MDYKEMTLDDVEQLKEEIAHFYKLRKLFLGLGWGAIVLGILSIFLIYTQDLVLMYTVAVFSPISICGGIIILILRGPLFNRRIRNRRNLVNKAIEYRKNKQLFEDTDK